ncbi:hypothetical protein P4H39_29140 [Paenibacillus lautus]|uniref:hypothetical protein n=1 Tax=Paenibacillus lautus TaxID=1401 RepID=UPI002DBD766C|nr:hypothetical protein [Paenibacillus lautus]MEC0206677.1 hypothetical protein [Paenibacillus lautus]
MKIQPEPTEVDRMTFFWPERIKPSEYGIYRVSTDDAQRRMAEDLPPKQVAVAVKSILSSQISLPYDELMKQVVKALGYARSGSALKKSIKSGIHQQVVVK